MTQFWALLRLELSQWKVAFNMSAGRNKKKDHTVSRMLGILALVLFIAVYMVFLELKAMDLFQFMGKPELLPKLLVTFSMLLTFMLGLFQVISSLYFSKDIAILGYLPVKSTTTYAARFCGSLVQEIATSVLFIVPGTIVYFTRMGFDAGMLIRALLATVFSPVIPLCLAALLAGLLTKLPGFWKHREMVTTIFSILVILGTFFLSFSISSMQSSAASDEAGFQNTLKMVSDLLDGITVSLPPLRWFSEGLAVGGLNLLLGIAASAAALALIIFLFGKNYMRVASQALENAVTGKKVDMKKETIRGGSPLSALVRREMREMLRTPAYLTNGLLISVLMPVLMIGVMLFSINSNMEGGIAAMVKEVGIGKMELTVVSVVITAMMSLLMGMNATACTAVSREGTRHALMRSLPVSTRTILMSKLWTALIFQIIGIIPAVAVVGIFVPNFWMYAAMILVWTSMLAFIGACLGLIIDVSRPKMDWINETQAIKSGFNQIISLLVYLAMMGLLALGSYFFLSAKGASVDLYLALLTGILLLLCFGAYLWAMRSSKSYEKIGE